MTDDQRTNERHTAEPLTIDSFELFADGHEIFAFNHPTEGRVEFTVSRSGKVGHSNNWCLLIQLADSPTQKDPRFSTVYYGPTTWGHTEIIFDKRLNRKG